MGVIAKYKFDQTTYENFIPEFNSTFTDYTITDETDTDGYTIRTIESDSLPKNIMFGQWYNAENDNATPKSLSLLEIYEMDLSTVTFINSMFRKCENLTAIHCQFNCNFDIITDMQEAFRDCFSLVYLDVSNFNTKNVTNMQNMFSNCRSLTSLDVSNFNTEKVTNMNRMFQNCSSLTSLDVSNLKTEKVINMGSMFQACSSLTHLDISSFDGSALTTGCDAMFFGCVLLQEIIFPKKFITNKCTNISAMFRNCPSLKYVDVSDWDTSSVTTINQTFNGCKSLTSLDLSSWDTTNVTSYYQAFNGCTSLQSLDISNFNILSSVTDTNTHIIVCKKLVHVGMLYCNSETINIIANQIGGTRTIWYQDANLSDLTQLDNITYKKYQSTTLSLNEPIQLRSIGDIYDEINYETGEYIQRIGEVVLDGSDDEKWNFDTTEPWTSGEYYTFYTHIQKSISNYNASEPQTTNSKYPDTSYAQARQDGIGCFLYSGGGQAVAFRQKNITTLEDWKTHLQDNPITVQYRLANELATKIDTTTLDQNNNYKSSQQTYDEQTYVSVQSDTVVTPTSSVDYEIYSSTGTVTGTSATIENAEAGTPVGGVVYGETLLNVIQEPSEDEFVITGDAFEEQSGTLENTVEGNIKSAILKGQTLVNLINGGEVTKNATNDWVVFSAEFNADMIKTSTDYTLITYVISNTLSDGWGCEFGVSGGLNDGFGLKAIGVPSGKVGVYKIKLTTKDVFSEPPVLRQQIFNNVTTGSITFKQVLVEGDYTNIDIPYFNGIGSVTNYRTIENMQPTCTYTENGGTYSCDTTTVNPTVGKQYFIKIFNNPNNAITRFFYGGVIVDTTTDYGIVTATDRTGMRLHFYNLKNGTVTITEEQKNAIRFLICEYQDGMENWEINEHFEESYTVQIPVLKTTGKNLSDRVIDILIPSNTNIGEYQNSQLVNIPIPKGQFYVSFKSNRSQMPLYIHDKKTQYYHYNRVVNNLTTDLGNHVKVGYCHNNVNMIVDNSNGYPYMTLLLSSGTSTVEHYIKDFMISSTSDAVYQPHKSTTVTVNENIELNSIGDVCDELNVTTGELTQWVGNITLDGNRNYSIDNDYNGETEDYFGFSMSLADYKPMESNANVLSEDIKIIPFKDLKNVSGEWITFRYPSSGVIYGKILKSKLTAQTIQGIQQYLSENPITLRYELATSVTRTVPILIIDQNNVQQKYVQTYDTTTYLKPQSYELIPTVEYKNPSYDVLLKPNTEYTIKTNRTNRATLTSDVALDVNLGGSTISMDSVTNHVKVKTPSTLENNTLTLSGFGNKVKDIMVIEGDYVDRDLDYFEGFISVENPIMNIYHDMNNINFYNIVKWEKGNEYSELCRLPIEGQTIWYKVNGSMWNYVQYYDKDKNYLGQETNQGMGGSYQLPNGLLKPELKSKAVYFSINKRGNPINGGYPQLRTKNNKPDVPPTPLSEICRLTTYPQVTLRSIGDIKDEWDVVGETVTRRIGEVVLDGSEDWKVHNYGYVMNSSLLNIKHITTSNTEVADNFISNKIPTLSIQDLASNNYDGISPSRAEYKEILIFIKEVGNNNLTGFKEWLKQNPITVQYELAEPITESVRITPPNPQTSTASITISTQLNHVEDTSDFLVWNPYKEHYVRYNYVEDGVVLDNYTWENLTDLNERQFVEFYNKRTYIDQPYHNYVASHDSKGTSKYVLIEPNQDYTVSVRFSELPTCETVKVNLGGAEVEMNVNDPHVHVTTPNTLVNNLCSISGDGLDGKVTDILVIHCLEHEGFADIDYFEGIDGIGEIVEVEGVPKSKIIVKQTNGNLLDFEPVIFNNGNYISMGWNENHRNIPLKANTSYRLKIRKCKDVTSNNGWGDIGCKLYTSELVNTRNVGIDLTTGVANFTTENNEKYLRFYKQQSHNGNTNIHEPLELTYAHFTDNELIRPRYHDKEEILLPIQLHRINTVYDNFYYDEMKGYYRIQQSIGHKYFVGADSENWTLIERGQRVLRFRYNNADIQMKSLGEFMTNRLPNGTATSPYECCAFNGINFIVSIDKERLSSESLTAFKEWLANNNLHLYYQLASPLMIDLPEYSSRIEFNTYKDEIYTFFKNCKPTVFTLAVPLDQTYRFYELEQSEGYANRVELTDERMTEEDTLYINTIYGSGISNLIEEPNNVDTMLKPNYEGKATSHSLINGKVSTIGVHGFEPNNVTISNYNTVTKQYELTVQANQGTNTNTETLAVPYKLEIYEDGTKDRVYYNSQYKQWMFEGGQTLTVPYNTSTGAFTNVVEVFRGLQPRSGLIGEFKVKFASGTTSARLYYSINGTTYGYTTLRGMTDEVDYYIGFFNTGGTKIDMGTKIDANAEYTTLVPINATIPECLMINQIQNITECTYYQDKTYYYSDVVSPLVLDVYDGTTTITELNGAVIDIQNNAHNKQALIYGDTTYTVYWTYVGGEGNIKVTLGGVTQEVVATQGYVTITTSDTDLERGLFIGGFNVTIKDLMLVKGERIENLKYFEGSRAVGTAFTDENGETMYKITLVTGSELINDKFEDMITFEDNKKHNVVVTKLLGAKPNKN